MILYGRIRGVDGESRLVEVEGVDHDAAWEALRALPEEGELLLSVARWPV